MVYFAKVVDPILPLYHRQDWTTDPKAIWGSTTPLPTVLGPTLTLAVKVGIWIQEQLWVDGCTVDPVVR